MILARQRRFVQGQLDGVNHTAIGRDPITGAEEDEIADHQILGGELVRHPSIAQDRACVWHQIGQGLQGLLAAIFLDGRDEAHDGQGQRDGDGVRRLSERQADGGAAQQHEVERLLDLIGEGVDDGEGAREGRHEPRASAAQHRQPLQEGQGAVLVLVLVDGVVPEASPQRVDVGGGPAPGEEVGALPPPAGLACRYASKAGQRICIAQGAGPAGGSRQEEGREPPGCLGYIPRTLLAAAVGVGRGRRGGRCRSRGRGPALVLVACVVIAAPAAFQR